MQKTNTGEDLEKLQHFSTIGKKVTAATAKNSMDE